MTIYYKLVLENPKIPKEEIGDIIDQISTNLSKEYGFSLHCDCLVYQNIDVENLNILNEDVLPMNLSDEDKKKYILTHLEKIKPQNEILYIMDPYIFPHNTDDNYLQFLAELLQSSKAKKTFVITHKNYNKDLYGDLTTNIDNVEILINENCHDRFWIVPKYKTGFVLGTSLNGIGKKLCILKILDAKEVELIIEYLNIVVE